MANNVILLKRASSSGAIPAALANGELGLDFWTGNLWFKAANGSYRLVNPAVSGGVQDPDYGTVNVNGTLLVSGVQGDVLSLIPGSGITLEGFTGNDTVKISSSGGGGGYFKGNQGTVGDPSNVGDIFRVNHSILEANVTIEATERAIAVGPLVVNTGIVLVISDGGRGVIA